MSTSIIEQLEARRLLSADLVGELTGHLPTALALPGQVNHLNVRLTNEGNTVASGAATISLFASTDTTLDAGDVLLTSVTPGGRLPEGRSRVVPLRFASPTTLTDGEYFLLTKVDTAASSATTASTSPVKIQSPFSDLAVSFASLLNKPVEIDGPSAGQRGALIKIVNNGNIAATGNVRVNLYLSSDAVLDGSDPLLAAIPARSIALRAGTSRAFGLRIAVPPGTAVGGYFLFATVTPIGITDADVSDNVAITSQRVAVVDKIPRPRIERREVIVYYDGPDYIDDDSDGYGYFSDTYVPAPDDQTPMPVDQGDDGSTSVTDPGKQGGTNSEGSDTPPADSGATTAPPAGATTQPTDPGTTNTPPSTTQPSTEPTTDPSTGDDDSTNGGDDTTPAPVDNGGDDSTSPGDSGGSSDGSDIGTSDSSDTSDDLSGDAVILRSHK